LVEVALPIWNKVLLVPIHLAFFFSGNGDGRVRWGSSFVETLFRSLPAAHRLGWKVRFLAFWFEDKEAVSGCVEVWRVDLVRISSGGVCCRRRAGVHGRWSSGCVPGRCSSSDGFIPSRTGVYCGYLQSLMAIGLLPTWDSWWRSSGDGRRQRSRVVSTGRVSRVLFVIPMFGRGLCVNGRDSCLLYPSRMYLYVYCLCTLLNV